MMPVESPEEGARIALAVEATFPLAVVSSAPNVAVVLQDTLGWTSPCNHSKETLLSETILLETLLLETLLPKTLLLETLLPGPEILVRIRVM